MFSSKFQNDLKLPFSSTPTISILQKRAVLIQLLLILLFLVSVLIQSNMGWSKNFPSMWLPLKEFPLILTSLTGRNLTGVIVRLLYS